MSELYKLPTGWEWKKLDSISSIVGGGTPKRNIQEYWENGSIVWLSPTDLGNIGEIKEVSSSKDMITKLGLDKSSAKLLPIGTVLYSSRATIGKIAINKIEVSTNQGFTNFICNDDLYNYYLAYCLSNFTNDIVSLSNSTTFKEVSKSSFKSFQIPLPPLAEQKRIVAKLDSLFEKIDKAIELHQQNITNANTLMASTLDKTFKKLEGEYGNKTLSDSVENPKKDIVDGPFGSNLKATEYIQKGVPIIRIQNIQRLEFINKDIKFVSEEKAEFLKRHSFIASDIVITKLGEPLGKSCIVPHNLERGIIVADIIRVRVDSSKCKNKYIMYAINSAIAINQFSENSMGSTRQRVKLSIVRDLKIPLPPLPIQQQTVEYLDSIATKVDKIKQLNEQKLENLKALKASILDKAFRGEL
ncbi:restriction endonuclease subunit S [Francisella tularensis]|uniref:restriction endonuclease subunit S n=1 Tax=Francisella tularensis TaxID=263 RepID=UPI0008FD220B|nr:restriction endonuclease subunit S [Francisella tularensis]APC95059.1 type I restriction modification DNA specificity domain protein [Francisella tularensis subsp. novicida]